MRMKIFLLGLAMLAAATVIDSQERLPGGPPESTPPTDRVKPPGENRVTIREENGKRIIDANGIADHDVGKFPRRGNPNSIAPQNYHFEMTLQPKIAARASYVSMGNFGVAVNGLVFDPAAAEWYRGYPDSGWRYEAKSGKINLGLDINNAHVQPQGAYHYHGIPTLLVKKLNPDDQPRMVKVGWAADGFPIYARWDHSDAKDASSSMKSMRSSYRLKQGTRPGGPGGKFDGTFVEDYEYVQGSGDLDECGGRTGPTPDHPEGEYHYVLTDDYPFIPRLFKGTPDASFSHRGPPPGGGPPGMRGQGRPPFGQRPPRGGGFGPPPPP